MSSSVSSKSVNCPVCLSNCDDAPLYRYTASEAAAHFCPTTRDPERNQRLQSCIRRLWQGDECTVLRCRQCGFAFGDPFVGGDEEFYSILHEQKGYPSWRWDYDMALEVATTQFGSGRILEIGAGVGNFLKRLGPQWQCYAIEASDSNRKQLEEAGINVFRDLSEAAKAEAGTFQLIVLFQVLEHIATFQTLLQECRRLLQPGGRIVITVPDGDAMIRQEQLTGCHDMPPNHINKWTPKSLSLALSKAGFKPGEAINEQPSWQNLKMSLYMRVGTDATYPNSIAAQVYRISNKQLRQPLLAFLGLPALLRMLPSVKQLMQGGAFGMVAEAQ